MLLSFAQKDKIVYLRTACQDSPHLFSSECEAFDRHINVVMIDFYYDFYSLVCLLKDETEEILRQQRLRHLQNQQELIR